ncbi:IS3 family transposase [Kitasatospora kifunensis]|uniref:IS3 family transposase n=1 Tax=Kitasatospora kifunensis TaxID=58351 RepID=UPI0035E461BF
MRFQGKVRLRRVTPGGWTAAKRLPGEHLPKQSARASPWLGCRSCGCGNSAANTGGSPPGPVRRADHGPARRIDRIRAGSDSTYGSPRITAEVQAAGRAVNHRRVERVTRERGIAGCTCASTHLGQPVPASRNGAGACSRSAW